LSLGCDVIEKWLSARVWILGVVAMAFVGDGCGSSLKGNAGSAGRGGSAGKGGSAGGVAGASGGAGEDASLTDGGGDTWVANGCPASPPAVGALISDFETADGGVAVIPIGRMVTSGLSNTTSFVENGAWHVSSMTTGSPGNLSATLVFDTCVDARAYDGVSFTVRGSGFDCDLGLLIVDTAHAPLGGELANGSGPPDAQAARYGVGLPLEPGGDAAATTTIHWFSFSNSQWVPANPAAPTDASKLIALKWVFSGQTDLACTRIDITIDDLAFFREGADGGVDARVGTGG